jgi:cyclopropane fatty-acyl-phospholipid synthase-like methyltransferase
VVAKLERGGRVADVGCGHGASTILMAEAFPNATFVGFDYYSGSIETARERADQAGVSDRVSFQMESAAAYSGTGYDLVTMFDCLHDMGDPVGAARHVHSTLADDGTSRTTSTRSAGRTTPSPPSSALLHRSLRRWGWPWVRRPARRESATWCRPVD